MEISDVDVQDDAVLDALFDLYDAAGAVDCPDNPPTARQSLRRAMRQPEHTEHTVRRLARVDGRIIAFTTATLPLRDNRHLCAAELTVHPDFRRRGIGSAMLDDILDTARSWRRRTVVMDTLATGNWDDATPRPEAGVRFLERHGFELALTSVNRRAATDALDAAATERLHAEALAASTGYETIAWTGRLPEYLLEPLAALNSTFFDETPLGDLELENEDLDADRVRIDQDQQLERGDFVCGVVARPKGSTEVVANTAIQVEAGLDTHAFQEITLVAPEHRGHRLGLRTKVENLLQLRRVRPDVRFIDTDNAGVNDHMIAINERMGFRRVDHLREYQRRI